MGDINEYSTATVINASQFKRKIRDAIVQQNVVMLWSELILSWSSLLIMFVSALPELIPLSF
jgi:hypothetical protein